MSNKYLLKVATIIDMGADGKVDRIHSDPELEHRARNAKLLNPSSAQRAGKALRRASVPAAIGAAGLAGYGVGKLVRKAREKQAQLFSPDRKKEMAQTGVLMGTGVAAAGALDRFVKPRMNFHGALGKAKYVGLIGGANLAADYAAVKINKAIERHGNE